VVSRAHDLGERLARDVDVSNTKTAKQITFHDLRATGITWMAVRGDTPTDQEEGRGTRAARRRRSMFGRRRTSIPRRPDPRTTTLNRRGIISGETRSASPLENTEARGGGGAGN
jgi:hypothetical protein